MAHGFGFGVLKRLLGWSASFIIRSSGYSFDTRWSFGGSGVWRRLHVDITAMWFCLMSIFRSYIYFLGIIGVGGFSSNICFEA
jgi:hypothetical protein